MGGTLVRFAGLLGGVLLVGSALRAGARTYALAKPLTRGDLKIFAPRPFGEPKG